ncbi:39S ribosomal protein L18, mitochondrial [Harmonia axyridis]|uniref:39S ribosomal protein L18, mitochondrial n=1 Tax=Harmonia axyridis TaxID=115357 RepID=UPI001E27954D|nr:39S ribosomal protein L18, mitochondrial [Harmonia axyridis]
MNLTRIYPIALRTALEIRKLSNVAKSVNNFEIPSTFINRNPRNLEKLRIGYKPDGYHLEAPGRIYWHKLELMESGRYVVAVVKHFKNGEVLKASTSEWPIKKRLYRYNDVSAYINLAKVLGDRCVKSGLTEMSCFMEVKNPDGKLANFLKYFEESGIVLKEPPQFKPARPWDQLRPEKPWDVLE